MRFPLECFDAMRAAMPDGLPLIVRFSGTDPRRHRRLEHRRLDRLRPGPRGPGADAVDVSTGGNAKAEILVAPGFQVLYASAVKHAVDGMPVIAVGELGDPLLAEDVPERGDADAIAIGKKPCDSADPGGRRSALGGEVDYVDQYAWCVG